MAYPIETRTQVEVAAACGMSPYQIQKYLGVSDGMVRYWLDSAFAERIRQRSRQYNEVNSDQIKVKKKKYREENREEINARDRKWREANHEKSKATIRDHYRRNSGDYKLRARIRDSKMRDMPITDIEKLMCSYYYEDAKRLTEETGLPHEVDHIWPLSKGGPHLPWNLQVLTKAENRRKSNNI